MVPLPMKPGQLSACGCQSRGCLCPSDVMARLIGRRYVVLVLSILANRGRTRFSDLRAHLRGISTSTLAAILKDLSARGVLVRSVSEDRPLRVEYTLSREGVSLAYLLRRFRRLTVERPE
jgi:DNA-binding HxlR family transcriptional regulator